MPHSSLDDNGITGLYWSHSGAVFNISHSKAFSAAGFSLENLKYLLFPSTYCIYFSIFLDYVK